MLAAAPAHAQDCANAADQMTLNICADKEHKAGDAKLNAAYGEIMKRLAGDDATKKLLQTAQRDWIAFRDAECAFQTSAASGGSIQPMLVSLCLATLTQDRVTQLEAYLHCEEGDMSCPVPAN